MTTSDKIKFLVDHGSYLGIYWHKGKAYSDYQGANESWKIEWTTDNDIEKSIVGPSLEQCLETLVVLNSPGWKEIE